MFLYIILNLRYQCYGKTGQRRCPVPCLFASVQSPPSANGSMVKDVWHTGCKNARGGFERMIPVLITSLALQLSVLLLFRKLGQHMKRPRIWTVAALALMAVPFSGTVYQLIQSHRTMIPLSDLVPLVGTFLATLVSLGILPVAYMMIQFPGGTGLRGTQDQCISSGRDCTAKKGRGATPRPLLH